MSSEIARRVVNTFKQNNEDRLAQFNLSPREKEIAERAALAWLRVVNVADAGPCLLGTVRA